MRVELFRRPDSITVNSQRQRFKSDGREREEKRERERLEVADQIKAETSGLKRVNINTDKEI